MFARGVRSPSERCGSAESKKLRSDELAPRAQRTTKVATPPPPPRSAGEPRAGTRHGGRGSRHYGGGTPTNKPNILQNTLQKRKYSSFVCLRCGWRDARVYDDGVRLGRAERHVQRSATAAAAVAVVLPAAVHGEATEAERGNRGALARHRPTRRARPRRRSLHSVQQ